MSFWNSLLVYGDASGFLILTLYHKIYQIHWLALRVLWYVFMILQIYYHLQIVTVLLLFQFEFILFHFLLRFLWLWLSMTFQIYSPLRVVKADILVFFLILVEMLSGFHLWKWCLLWVCSIWLLAFIWWGRIPLCPLSEGVLS